VLLLGIDQYTGGPGTLPMPWLEGILKPGRFKHVFAFGHEMAFMAGNHTDCLDRNPADRDSFWRLLAGAGGKAYFAGHDHFYDHLKVLPEAGELPELHQFVAGTSGAPFYPDKGYSGKNDGWKVERVLHLDNTYGYLLVEVDGPKCTITFKGRKAPGVYAPMDSWSYLSGK